MGSSYYQRGDFTADELSKQANDATRQFDVEAGPNENTLIVTDLHGRRTVNKELMTCDCGVPLTRSHPCIHLFVMSNHERIPKYKLFNHDFYSVEKWQSQFPEGTSLDQVSLDEVKELFNDSSLLKEGVESERCCAHLRLPVSAAASRGRPSAGSRHTGPWEKRTTGRTVTCKNCGERGHNTFWCINRAIEELERA